MAAFPLPDTQYKKLWLDASDGSMKTEQPKTESSFSYDASIAKPTIDVTADGTFNFHRETPNPQNDRAVFSFQVPKETELIGHMKLRVWVEASGNDDMDLFIAVKKLDADGKWLPLYIMGKPHPGTPGRLRVSLRELDEEKTTDYRPYQTLNNPQKLVPGEIVPVDIDVWPSSRVWHAGEQISVEIMGYYQRFDWYEPFDFNTVNKGSHIIHTGGKYDSYLQIPLLPDSTK